MKAQPAKLGMYRWLILSLMAYLLAHTRLSLYPAHYTARIGDK
ncbi:MULTISPECIES: hypothetical protein [Cyanophyceae]|nr:hypothetical protein [Trichocoleus sp. FACHB-69]